MKVECHRDLEIYIYINKHVLDLCSFATLMVYKIPMEDVKSLAKSFAQLESGKKCTHSNHRVFVKS